MMQAPDEALGRGKERLFVRADEVGVGACNGLGAVVALGVQGGAIGNA